MKTNVKVQVKVNVQVKVKATAKVNVKMKMAHMKMKLNMHMQMTMQMPMTMTMAVAAHVDQIDRALCGNDGEPHRDAVRAAIVSTPLLDSEPVSPLPDFSICLMLRLMNSRSSSTNR